MFKQIIPCVLLTFSLISCSTTQSSNTIRSIKSVLPGSNMAGETITYNQATLQELKRITDDGLSKDWQSISPDFSMLLYCESLVQLKWNNISDEHVKSFQIMLLKDADKAAKTQLVTDKSICPAWYNNDTFLYSVIEGGVPKLIKSNIAGGGKLT
jgi:hypothetical protein